MPDASRLLLLAAILCAGLVSLSQQISIGPVTGLGMITILSCGGAWLLWLTRPRLAREHLTVLLPLVLFAVYAVGSVLWSSVDILALQLLCVLLGFAGLVLVAAREVEDDPTLAKTLYRAVDVATWFATGVYALSLARDGLGAESIILARPYALFVLIGLARQLALWQSGDRRGLLGTGIILAVVLASISRTALAAALMLVPLAALVRGRKKDVAFAVGGVVAGGLVVAAALALSPTIYERFFGFDANMRVAGVAINTSGRMEMWVKLWDSAITAPWLGHGVASSSQLIGYYFPYPGVGHPHNDYLRFFHDFGMFGLGLWLAFHAGAAWTLFKRARAAARKPGGDPGYHLVPMLGFVALAVSMTTDNAVCYTFVMAPLAVLFGCSLGLASRAAAVAAAVETPAPAVTRLTRQAVARRRQLATARAGERAAAENAS